MLAKFSGGRKLLLGLIVGLSFSGMICPDWARAQSPLPPNSSTQSALESLSDSAVAALWKQGRWQDAAELHEKRLAGLKPQSLEYKRGLIVQTFLLDKVKSPYELVFQAREALEANQDSAVAHSNLGVLQLITGDYAYAKKLAEEVLVRKKDDWLAPIIQAQALANMPGQGAVAAVKTLDGYQKARPQISPQASYDSLLYSGETYWKLGNAVSALKMFQQAAAVSTTTTTTTSSSSSSSSFSQLARADDLSERLFCAALAAADKKQAQALLPTIFKQKNLKADTLLLMARHLELLASSVADRKRMAGEISALAFRYRSLDAELFYSLGRCWQNFGLKSEALHCLEKAVKAAPHEGKYVLAYCRELVGSGKSSQARELLSGLAAALKEKEPSVRHMLVSGLVPASLRLLEPGRKVSYKVSRASLQGVKCYCRVAAIIYILRHQPGVIFAYMPDGTGPDSVIIYEEGAAKAEDVWGKIGKEAKVVIRAEKNQPAVNSFPVLFDLAARAWEAPVHEIHPHYMFEPLPLRLP